MVRAVATTMKDFSTEQQATWMPVLREASADLRILFRKNPKKIVWLDKIEGKAMRREDGWESATADEMSGSEDSDVFDSDHINADDSVKVPKPAKQRKERKRKAPVKTKKSDTERVPCDWCGKKLVPRSLKRHKENSCSKAGKQETGPEEAVSVPSGATARRVQKFSSRSMNNEKHSSSSEGGDQASEAETQIMPVRVTRSRACAQKGVKRAHQSTDSGEVYSASQSGSDWNA